MGTRLFWETLEACSVVCSEKGLNKMHEMFRKFSNKTSEIVGSPWAFMIAALVIVLWAVSGPIFGFSDTWQLVINTSTTIITFLMVFIIQNTQNRDNKAIQLKLDELIRSQADARNSMLDLENLSDEELKRIQKEFDEIWESRELQSASKDRDKRTKSMAPARAN